MVRVHQTSWQQDINRPRNRTVRPRRAASRRDPVPKLYDRVHGIWCFCRLCLLAYLGYRLLFVEVFTFEEGLRLAPTIETPYYVYFPYGVLYDEVLENRNLGMTLFLDGAASQYASRFS